MSYILINTPSDFLKLMDNMWQEMQSNDQISGQDRWSIIKSEPPSYPCALTITSVSTNQIQFNFFPIKNP